MRSVFCNVSEVILDLNFCLLTLDFSVYTTVYILYTCHCCGVTYTQLYSYTRKALHSPSVSMDQVRNHWMNLCIIHG